MVHGLGRGTGPGSRRYRLLTKSVDLAAPQSQEAATGGEVEQGKGLHELGLSNPVSKIMIQAEQPLFPGKTGFTIDFIHSGRLL